MNIVINYKLNDFISDAIKAANIKGKLLYSDTITRTSIFAFLPLSIFLMGFGLPHSIFHTILESCCLMFFIILVYYVMILTLAKRKLRKYANNSKFKYDGMTEIFFSINDKGFCYREKEAYHEYAWDYFSGYLVIEGLIFFISKRFKTAFFVSQKQLYKEQLEELNTFLSGILPVADISSLR